MIPHPPWGVPESSLFCDPDTTWALKITQTPGPTTQEDLVDLPRIWANPRQLTAASPASIYPTLDLNSELSPFLKASKHFTRVATWLGGGGVREGTSHTLSLLLLPASLLSSSPLSPPPPTATNGFFLLPQAKQVLPHPDLWRSHLLSLALLKVLYQTKFLPMRKKGASPPAHPPCDRHSLLSPTSPSLIHFLAHPNLFHTTSPFPVSLPTARPSLSHPRGLCHFSF